MFAVRARIIATCSTIVRESQTRQNSGNAVIQQLTRENICIRTYVYMYMYVQRESTRGTTSLLHFFFTVRFCCDKNCVEIFFWTSRKLIMNN